MSGRRWPFWFCAVALLLVGCRPADQSPLLVTDMPFAGRNPVSPTPALTAGATALSPLATPTHDAQPLPYPLPVPAVPATSEPYPLASPVEQPAPRPTPTPSPTQSPVEQPALRPTLAPSPTQSPAAAPPAEPLPSPTLAAVPTPPIALDWVLLHTNDTWGYYDPCG